MAYRQSKGFSTIACSGQGSLLADEHKDTLTFVGGDGVTITTEDSTDTLTITSATEVSDDTSPVLGGDLDVGGKDITSTSNGHIAILPHGIGKVGIGTRTPAAKLTVVDTTADVQILRVEGGDGNAYLQGGNKLAFTRDGGCYISAVSASGSLGLETAGSTRLTVASNGNIGIGTTSPGKKLDLSGDLKVSGTTTLNSVEYTWPSSDGSSGQHLTTNASGALSWGAAGSGATALLGLTDTPASFDSGKFLKSGSSSSSWADISASDLSDVTVSGVSAGELLKWSGSAWVNQTLSEAGVDSAGTDNSTNVSLSGALDYLTISGQVITRNAVDLTSDITGTLPIGSGGTGLTSVTSGHVLYASGTDTIASASAGATSGVQAYHSHLDKIASAGNGSDGQVLTSDGAGEIAWETVSGGGGGSSVDLLGSSTSAITAGDSSALTAAKTSAYTVSTTNVVVPTDSSSAAVTITLYAASGNAGRIVCIKDVGGAAYTNNITIDANSSETIDGATTQTIASNYGSVSMFCNGSAWFII